jgi:hypothetical protein
MKQLTYFGNKIICKFGCLTIWKSQEIEEEGEKPRFTKNKASTLMPVSFKLFI